jgi:hypothetical protein
MKITFFRRCSVTLLSVLAAACTVRIAAAAEPQANANITNGAAGGTPMIQFETNFFDFGKLVSAGPLNGVFKFKNAGDGVLKVDPPIPSCGCTDARVTPAVLAPGQEGRITYTITLDQPAHGVRKQLHVHSNDPKTPDVQLTMQLDYTPLYDLMPRMLRIVVAPGKDMAQGSFTVTRNDGQPLDIDRLTTSQKWISADLQPEPGSGGKSARVNVTVHRAEKPPTTFVAGVQLWSSNQPAKPLQTMTVNGEIRGELSAMPPQLYWAIPDFGEDKSKYPPESLMRTVVLRSVLGKTVELKNPSTTVPGMRLEINAKEPGKVFDLVMKFDELPHIFTNGMVTVETSLASLPKVEIPVTISVPNPR